MAISAKKALLFAIASISFFALALQFYITVNYVLSSAGSVLDAVLRYLSFFTIVTNLMVLISSVAMAFFPHSTLSKNFSKPLIITAITLSIFFVAMVYHFVLKQYWHTEGAQSLTNVLLHYFTPTLFIVYWLYFVPKSKLSASAPLVWSLYPLAYLFYVFLRGALTGKYPYFFIDVGDIGYTQSMSNALYLELGFLFFGYILLGLIQIYTSKSFFRS